MAQDISTFHKLFQSRQSVTFPAYAVAVIVLISGTNKILYENVTVFMNTKEESNTKKNIYRSYNPIQTYLLLKTKVPNSKIDYMN